MSVRAFALSFLAVLGILMLGACDRGSAGVLVTRAPSMATSPALVHQPVATSQPSVTAVAAGGEHTWYTSASKSAKDYYCELDSGWKQIVAANLRTYSSEADLLANWPGMRVKSPSSKC
jgi:hypothetical protein